MSAMELIDSVLRKKMGVFSFVTCVYVISKALVGIKQTTGAP